MTESTPSIERRILSAVRIALAGVIRDTATPAGMQHPLSDQTIEDLRQCLALISARERELTEAAGVAQNLRPRYADEPAANAGSVVRFYRKPGDGPADG